MSDGSIIFDTGIDGSGARKSIGELKKEVNKLAEEYKKSGMSSSEAFQKAWSEVERNSKQGASAVEGNIQGIAGIAKRCAAVVGGLFLLDKAKDFAITVAKTGISYNAMNEQAQVAWATILGSQDKASKMMSEIQKYAAKTPFSKMGVDTMAKQLTNAGFHGQALFDQLTKIGDMGSAFGLQEDSLKELVRQYAQVQQAGVAYTEDLNILQDRGIPIYKALGKTMGVPVSQVKKLASQGKVTASVYNKAIDSIANKTKGAMDAQSRTFNGMLSTIQDNLEMLAGSIMKPAFDLAKQGLGVFADGLDFLNDKISETGSITGAFGAIVESVFGGATGSVNPFQYAISNGERALQRLSQVASNEIGPIFDNLKGVFSSLGTILKPVGDTLIFLANVVFVSICDTVSTMIHVFSDFMGILNNVASVVSSTIGPALGNLFGAIQDYAERAADIFLGTILPAIEDFADKITATFNTYILPVIQQASEFISQNVLPILTGAFEWLTDVILPKVESIFKAVWPSIENIVCNAVKIIGAIIQNLIVAFKFLWPVVKVVFTIFKAVFTGIVDIVGPIIEVIIGIISGLSDFLVAVFVDMPNYFRTLWGNVCNAFTNAWNSIVSFFTTTIPGWINNLKQWFIGLPAWFGQIWESVKTWFVTKWNEIWTYLATNIPIWINNIFTWFSELPYKIGFALGFVVTKIAMWGVSVWNYFVTNIPIWINSIGNWFAQLPGRIWTWLVATITKIGVWGTRMYYYAVTVASQFISNVINYICELPGRIWTWLCNTVSKVANWGSQMWSRGTSVASQFVSRVISYICQLPGRMWTWLCNAASRVGSWGSSLFSRGVSAASQLVRAVVDTVSKIPGQMIDIGKHIVEGVWTGITGAAGWFADKVHSFFSGIVSGAKKALDVHSPSKRMRDEVGKWILPGVEVGMDNTMPSLTKNIKDKMDRLTKTMKTKVMAETSIVGASVISRSNFELNSKKPEYVTTNNDNGITQNIVFNEPVESPSDVARKVKQVGRDLIFG